MFQGIDIHQELLDQRKIAEDELLSIAENILQSESAKYRSIEHRIDALGAVTQADASMFASRIFNEDELRSMAIKYGLRFLPARYYDEHLPQPAMSAVKELEEDSGVTLEGFKILAPEIAFELEDENVDPLLFASLADGRYLFIHKWGNDLAWYRALAQWPKRNVLTLITCIALLSLGIVMSLPEQWFNIDSVTLDSATLRMVGFFWMNIVLGAISGYVWFAFRQRFSADVWNHRFE